MGKKIISKLRKHKTKYQIKQNLLILIIFCLLFSGCATLKPDLWTKNQMLLQGVATSLKIIDWGQTLDIADKPDQYYETNPILGEHPSKGDVNKWFMGCIGIDLLITHIMPSKYRNYWLGLNILISGYYIENNYSIGLRMNY